MGRREFRVVVLVSTSKMLRIMEKIMEFWEMAIPSRVLGDWPWENPRSVVVDRSTPVCDCEFQEQKRDEAVSCHGYNGVAYPARRSVKSESGII
jgi:hypothetical protein